MLLDTFRDKLVYVIIIPFPYKYFYKRPKIVLTSLLPKPHLFFHYPPFENC